MTRGLLVLVALCVGSCAISSSPGTTALVGHWRSANSGQVGEYSFLANGTFTGNVTSCGALLAKFTGKWRLRAGVISYEYLSDATGNIAPGTKDQDKLIAFSPDRYTIEAADGSRRTYLRIRDSGLPGR